MAVNLSPLGGAAAQFFDNNGVPLAGGKLYSYAASTTTPQAAYTTVSGGTAWSNPIVLNSAGRVSGSGQIWLTDGVSYKFVLNDANDVLIGTYDNVKNITDASQITYTPAGTGAVATTVQTKLRQTVSVMDFGAVGNGSTDDTTAITAANTYCAANNATLSFPAPASFYKITSNVVLTCDMTAGWYQLFDSASAYTVAGLREIRFEWWGAKGNAVNPNVAPASFNPATNIPTGTNDTVAIQKAVACATATSMGWSGTYLGGNGPGVFISQSFVGKTEWYYPCVVKGRPGSSYLVSGTNVFGPQSQVFGASSRFYFDGQGCNFAWLPTLSSDAFIDYLDIWAQPQFRNFSLHTWGYTGNKGIFARCGDTILYQNLLDGPRFENVTIDRGGYYYATTASGQATSGNNALSKVFVIGGTNYNANWEISHCLFAGFNQVISCTNPNAVGIAIRNTQLFSWYNSITFFEFIGSYGGGFWMSDCIVEMLGSTTIFLKTSGSTGVSIPEFHVKTTRMETRATDYILIDSEFGQFYIDGLNPNYGGVTNASQISCVAKKYTMAIVFTNCWCPQNCQIAAYTAAEFATYGGNFDVIKFDNCTFPSGQPIVNWIKQSNLTAVTIPALFGLFLIMRKVQLVNGANHLPITYGNASTAQNESFTVRQAIYSTANGKQFINVAGVYPVGCLITSILVVADPATLATTDRIIMAFVGAVSTTTMLSATLVVKSEGVTSSQKGIAVVSSAASSNVLTGYYALGATLGTTAYSAQAYVTYQAITSAAEMTASQLSGASTQAAVV